MRRAPVNCSFLLLLLCPRFTARITELMKVLKELNAGRYERTMVTQQDKGPEKCSLAQASMFCLLTNCSYFHCSEAVDKLVLVPGSGRIINRDNIIK